MRIIPMRSLYGTDPSFAVRQVRLLKNRCGKGAGKKGVPEQAGDPRLSRQGK